MHASIHATITKKQFAELNEIAKQKFKGNFSQALRIKLGEESEKNDVVLRLRDN